MRNFVQTHRHTTIWLIACGAPAVTMFVLRGGQL